MKSKRIEFRPPDGIVPEGLTAGEEFDLVTRYRLKDSGEICVIEIGDTRMPGYESTERKSDSKPTYQDYTKSMVNESGE